MSRPPAEPQWYKDAIIYELHVRAFLDSNGDGSGDFRGLIEKLDYLQQLGVTAVWLLPFYPSPLRDNGYDIAEYTGIHPDYGSMRDVTRFIREAHKRGLRVITELVVNHTSDQHPWFQRARISPPGSAARKMYVWSDTDTRYAGTRIIFTDTETSNWAWDPVAGQYYFHRFFSHQPDLNYDNPRVRRAIQDVIRFWFDRGVDGLRLDAVPYLVEREGTNNENLPETHEVLREWRAFVDEHYPDRMLLAEANQWPADVRAYFGEKDAPECHMAFHFPVMPRIFMALHQEDRHPIVDILEQTPPIPETAQWALFLRNHDELTLEMVTDEERDYMYQTYATDPRMRLNVGIRRRLAPLLDNNRRAIELLNSLLFSLPGTPILYYGDEIGMGDNVFLGDRDGVRTPMQWSGDRNAGFSKADPARLYLPAIMDPLYGYQAVNVEAQERSPSSLLNWMRRMIALRRHRTVFGRGDLQMLHPANRSVLAYLRTHGDDVVLVVANLSRFVQPVELDLAEFAGTIPTEMLGGQAFPQVGDGPYTLSLGPHAFYWFDLVRQPARVTIEDRAPEIEELAVGGDWDELLEGVALERLERDVLPAFLPAQRWFGSKGGRVQKVRVADVVPLRGGAAPAWLALIEVATNRQRRTYTLPLAVVTGRAARAVSDEHPSSVIAEVRGARGRGLLVDGMASDSVALALLDLVGGRRRLEGRHGAIEARTTRAFPELYRALEEHPAVVRTDAEQSNTSLRFDNHLMLKLIRRIEAGAHPEIEVGLHLTDRAQFPRSPRFAGALEYIDRDGEPSALVALQEYAWNQGDGWTFTLHEIARFLEDVGIDDHPPDDAIDATPLYAEHARVLGVRTAELHHALADARGDEAFEPEPLTARDVQAVITRIAQRLRHLAAPLRRIASADEPEAPSREATAARAVLDCSERARDLLAPAVGAAGDTARIRTHGDYHLGQVLWVRNDFLIIDFEGEVGLPLEERRKKTAVFMDVAGMLRSFQYAALVGLQRHAETFPDPAGAIERLRPWATWWERRAAEGFVAGYLEAAEGAPFLPAEPADRERLLNLHLLDKALHELEYEVDHRPDWVAVPLHGVAALLEALDQEAS